MVFPPLTSMIRPGNRVMLARQRNRVIDVKGNEIVRPRIPVEIRSQRGPDVDLPTGRLIVCDPMTGTGDTPPLLLTLPPGVYPTEGYRVELPHYGDRLAFVILWINMQTPVRFRPAPREDEAGERLGMGEAFAFGTDSGSGCFIDASHAAAIGTLDTETYECVTNGPFPDAFIRDEFAGGSIVRFGTGTGDGNYGKAWGVNESDEPVCMVVDCELLETDLLARARMGPRRNRGDNRPWWQRIFG